jgi:signal transduction histidine kinase
VALPLEPTVAEYRLLLQVIETISSTLDLDEVLRQTVDLVLAATRGDACFLHLWDPEREVLELRAASDGFRHAVGRVTLRLGEGVAGWVALHRRVVVIPENKWGDPRYKYIPELRGELFTSLLSVPMVSRAGTLVGVFNVHARQRREFSQHDVAFIRSTASLVAGAIERANLFRALEEKELALEDLVRRTILAQEDERRRLAAEIHDGVTQQLVSAWYRLQAVRRRLPGEPARALRELTQAQELVESALDEARVAIHDLRPTTLDDLGLAASLRALAPRAVGDGVQVTVVAEELELAPHQEVALYRIAQEALHNVRKHAGAGHVQVELLREGREVVLRIRDDGRGFDPSRRPATSFGLLGMAERAAILGGRLSVESAPGGGTTVEVRLAAGESARRPAPAEPASADDAEDHAPSGNPARQRAGRGHHHVSPRDGAGKVKEKGGRGESREHGR